LIVLHTAEGAGTIEALGNFFKNDRAQVSSHAGIDDKPGVIGEYVQRQFKAWTQSNANPYSVSAELCAFAKWSPAEWDQHPQMLANTAAWIAEEARALGIPIVRLTPAQAQGGAKGVCQHVDLGAAGGGHWDCGPGFPIDRVIALARGGPAPAPQPSPPARPRPSPQPARGAAPPFPGRVLTAGTSGADVQQWQQQMKQRGWSIMVDGQYGPQSVGVCRKFQQEKGLAVDGAVGPKTWAAAWTAAVT
jgi:murein L,D-transpeptidase YcbB/YkuD